MVIEPLLAERGRFLAFLRKRVGEDAEEVLQAAYAKALERRGRVRRPGSVVAWFFRLLRNALADRARRARREARALEARAREEAARSPDDALESAVCRCVLGLARTLKPEYAEILRRVDVEGETVREAAGALRLSPNNAAVRLHRARAALRDRLEALCRACSVHGCLDCSCRGGV